MFGGKTQTHKYEYDVDNKNTVYIDALNRRIENTYDENANKIKTTMPNGSILESVYDTAIASLVKSATEKIHLLLNAIKMDKLRK